MTVGDICSRDVVVAPKSEMIVDAAKRMRTSHVGDPDHVNYLLVSDVMTSNLVTATEQDSIEAALKTMQEHGIRRLPIVDAEGTLFGILTLDDILRYLTARQSEAVAMVAREQQRERHYRA